MAAGDGLGRRTGATWETCRRTVGGGGFGCRNSGRRGGRHEVRLRRQEHSIRRERAGIGCGQSSEAKLEMLAQPSLASRASTGFPVTVTNKAQMIRTLASIPVLIALLFGISIAAKDRKTPVVDPTRGAIGVSIKIKGPTPL